MLGATVDDPLGVRLIGPAAGWLVFVGFLLFRGHQLPDQIAGRRAQANEI